MTRRPALPISFLAGTGVPPAHTNKQSTEVSAWEEARTLTKAAYTADEEGRHQKATEKPGAARALRPKHPGLIYGLAQTTTASGDAEATLDWLERYAALGATTDLSRADALTPLYTDPRFETIAQNSNPVPNNRTRRAIEPPYQKPSCLSKALPLTKTRDRDLLSAIYKRKIVAAAPGGAITHFASMDDGLWSPAGMKIDKERSQLVVASAATP